MQSSLTRTARRAMVIPAGALVLIASACADGPAQLGTPEYALQQLFSDRSYRSTEQMLAAYRPPAAEPETESAAGAAESGTVAAPSAEAPPPLTATSLPSVPAAVTTIELNEWYLLPVGAAYGYWYPYYHDPRPYRPFYGRLYGQGGYPRCFGGCGGLSVSIGSPQAGVRLNAGSLQSSSTSTVIVQPPFYDQPSLGGPRTLLPPVRTLR